MDKHSRRSADIKNLGIQNLLTPATHQLVNNLDSETYNHCCRLSLKAKDFGVYLQLSSQEIRFLILGAYFHDIGKALIPKGILNKPTVLTHQEWKIIKSHPEIDNTVLGFPSDLEAIVPIIQCHHEHWDGSGYPHGLTKEKIPYLARVVQILDIYDALTHKRSYKKTFSQEKAIAIIHNETARGWYQPALIVQFTHFIRKLTQRTPTLISFAVLNIA
ncbi:HD domain-containing protein [Tumidithrix helvetica PCC 7403]|uniref:HD-GYP domain-containing protein n=1 Tax=Tumidithrix helvetica TaxID=3457545 RepID=UPI003CB192CA